MKIVIKFALALLLLSPAAGAVDKSARQLPITMEADHVMIDDQKRVSVYSGNVKLNQGTINISADKISVFGDKQRLQKLVAEGSPVRFSQEEGPHGVLRGSATRLEYMVVEQNLLLTGGAELWQGDSQFSGGRIEFNLKQGLVKASGEKRGQDRVRVVIQPDQVDARPAKDRAKP